MLKSLPTQLAATLIFGPLGLAYSSMAAAVFLTLVLAVLFFSELGLYAFLLIWPVAAITGLVFVKLHNDGIRQSGSRLLLGPGETPDLAGTIGNWARVVSIVALVAIVGFIAYLYLPQNDGNGSLGQIVDVSPASQAPVAIPATETSESMQVLAEQIPASSTPQPASDGFAVVALPKRDVAPVIVGNGESASTSDSALVAQGVVVVREAVVNLRQGPGVNFSILTQVERGDRLTEYARDGQWVNVETEDSSFSGWIYGELVTTIANP